MPHNPACPKTNHLTFPNHAMFYIFYTTHFLYRANIWVFIAECLLSNKRKLTKSLFSLTHHLCNVRLFLTGKPIRIVKDDKNRRRGKTLHISTLSSSTHFLCEKWFHKIEFLSHCCCCHFLPKVHRAVPGIRCVRKSVGEKSNLRHNESDKICLEDQFGI